MIRALRTQHLWTFVAVGFLAPALFVAGLAARHPSPQELPAFRPAAPQLERKGTDFQIGFDMRPHGARRRLEFHPAAYALYPDVQVYWSGAPGSAPRDALRLGPLRPGGAYDVPEAGGAVLLYSVAHQKTVAEIPIEGRP